MIQIGIVGAGQLGSRHLQALALLKQEAVIHVVDPSGSSRERASRRFEEVANRDVVTTVQFHSSIQELPEKVDLVVVATNADVRRQVIERLLGHGTVRYLILEKVLFQKITDYDVIENFVESRGVKTWVNCPRREWPVYRALKKELTGKPIYEVRVSGSNWGLGCNAIHMIDLVAFLSGKSEYTLSTGLLDPFLTAAKRPGFIEFTGVLSGRFSSGPFFNIASYAQGNLPDIIEVCGEGFRWIVRETEKKLWIAKDMDGWSWSEESFDVPYQSRLTNRVVDRILRTGECDLTTYAESSLLHRPLLSGLLAHMTRIDPQRTSILCPIT